MARWCLPKAAYIPALGHLGPAASERKLKRRKIYGFSVAAGPAADCCAWRAPIAVRRGRHVAQSSAPAAGMSICSPRLCRR